MRRPETRPGRIPVMEADYRRLEQDGERTWTHDGYRFQVIGASELDAERGVWFLEARPLDQWQPFVEQQREERESA